jgi:hypothetical protein
MLRSISTLFESILSEGWLITFHEADAYMPAAVEGAVIVELRWLCSAKIAPSTVRIRMRCAQDAFVLSMDTV